MLIAANGDAWGISGPTFLIVYAVAAIALAALTVALRRKVTRGRPTKVPLGPIEAAYLIGGSSRAIAAAVAALRADRAVTSAGDGRLEARATSYTMRSPLNDAVIRAIQSSSATASALIAHVGVRRALDGVRVGLERKGLLLTPAERAQLRFTALPFGVLLVIGLVRLVADIQNDSAVGFLVAALIVVAVSALVWLNVAPRVTRAGRDALADVRAKHAHLEPSMSPAWDTYGSSDAALGVGLFGMAALMSMDPAFAEEAAIGQQLGLQSGGGGIGGWSGAGHYGGCGG
ncbi:TIGR04222 domain-containing membrane protein, partial [Actinomadura sp. HBU206391]|uniref:TIGR04222 domain-containing membrane protein n=1 Tax=Actinomadura sp. HBU206391 TaxID=2731692 RepID=UPI00164F3EEF